MSGMLPGVEVARRRRLHQRGGWLDSPFTVAYGSFRRRNHDAHHCSTSAASSSSSMYEDDGKLGGAAREARERLDGRLRASGTRRQECIHGETSRSSNEGRPSREKARTSSLKKDGSKRFLNLIGLINWKDIEQEECGLFGAVQGR